MRKLVFLIGLLIPVLGYGQNLLLNPSFESWDTSSTGIDSIPKFWHFFTRSSVVMGYVQKVPGFDGFGVQTVVIGDTSGYDAAFYHTVYRIDTLPFADDSLLLAIKVLENSNGISVRFYCYWKDSLGNNVGSAVQSSYSSDSPNWQELTVKTQRPSSDAKNFRFELRIYKYTVNPDSLILDEAYFGPVTTSVREKSSFSCKVPAIASEVLPVELSLSKPSNLVISLYTPDGRKVRTLYEGNVSGNMQSYFDVSRLERGVYFVVVNVDGISKNYRVIKF